MNKTVGNTDRALRGVLAAGAIIGSALQLSMVGCSTCTGRPEFEPGHQRASMWRERAEPHR